jgi:hypothetical protein
VLEKPEAERVGQGGYFPGNINKIRCLKARRHKAFLFFLGKAGFF